MNFPSSPETLLYAVPFLGLLSCIACGPLFFPCIWHHYTFPITLGWSLLCLSSLVLSFGIAPTGYHLLQSLFHEYLPFILMIGSLFTVTGGIHITLKGSPKPEKNLALLIGGALLASFIGTTGAAMLLIRPLLALNAHRQNKVHLVIFFIFAVANMGGTLTPLGDPPLFLGYLKGIPFEWPFQHLLLPFLVAFVPLMAVFLVIDRAYYKKELQIPSFKKTFVKDEKKERFNVSGKHNFIFLGLIVLLVWFSGYAGKGQTPFFLGLTFMEVCRALGLFSIMVLSLLTTPASLRQQNHFSWAPFKEVAEIFMGLFITLIPVIAMLQQGLEGPFKSFVEFLNPGNVPLNALYFWFTGLLSAFLDNAPTYLVFFNMAQGAVGTPDGSLFLSSPYISTLMAISCGAVFMGALTYIGNAPNFMVKAIAEEKKIPMPSFLGYMAWSFTLLVPLFGLLTLLFF